MASVLVPLAQGCEELEAVTIIDLLVRAGIDVTTAGLQAGPVQCSRGTVIQPATTLDEAMQKEYDMIVLPGGQPGATHLQQDERILALLKKMASNKRYTAAICAAPRVLAEAGIVDNKVVTSFPGAMDDVDIASMRYVDDPVVCDDKVITSRGPGTAMDFSLTLIETLLGKTQREEVEKGLMRP